MNGAHEMNDQIKYHEDRAAREMAFGLTAQSIPAARAHLQLSSLHRERVRALGGGSGVSEPPQLMS